MHLHMCTYSTCNMQAPIEGEPSMYQVHSFYIISSMPMNYTSNKMTSRPGHAAISTEHPQPMEKTIPPDYNHRL